MTPSELRKYVRELSERYRSGKQPYITSQEHRLAYIAARQPATKAVIEKVLAEIRSFPIDSLLDLGAGPGTGCLAGKFKKATCLEKDRGFVALGKELVPGDVTWIEGDFKDAELKPHDLVLMSYSLGEVPEKFWEPVLRRSWQAARQAVVVIEPGTPAGFARILKMRDMIISFGAKIYAPCPHSLACPMPKNDWCHFSVRLPRTGEHRFVKEGKLGYEDEKFSYFIAAKQEHPVPRILRHPLKGRGHIQFSLCTLDGLKNKTVTRKDPEYKAVKKLEWGDCF